MHPTYVSLLSLAAGEGGYRRELFAANKSSCRSEWKEKKIGQKKKILALLEEEQINEKYKRQRRGRGCSHIAGLQRITSDDHYFSFRQFRQIIGKTHSLITEGIKRAAALHNSGTGYLTKDPIHVVHSRCVGKQRYFKKKQNQGLSLHKLSTTAITLFGSEKHDWFFTRHTKFASCFKGILWISANCEPSNFSCKRTITLTKTSFFFIYL